MKKIDNVYNVIRLHRSSPKIWVYELVKEEVSDDMYKKTREFRIIWNKIFMLEICEIWLRIDNYYKYKQSELFCIVSGERVVERIYESLISTDNNIDEDLDINNQIDTYAYSDTGDDEW